MTRSYRCQYHRSALWVHPTGNDSDLGVGYLPVITLTAQLEHGFVEEPDGVQPAFGELASGGVHREVATWGEPAAVTDPVTELTVPACAQRLDPGDGHRSEAVIDLEDVDVVERE